MFFKSNGSFGEFACLQSFLPLGLTKFCVGYRTPAPHLSRMSAAGSSYRSAGIRSEHWLTR